METLCRTAVAVDGKGIGFQAVCFSRGEKCASRCGCTIQYRVNDIGYCASCILDGTRFYSDCLKTLSHAQLEAMAKLSEQEIRKVLESTLDLIVLQEWM